MNFLRLGKLALFLVTASIAMVGGSSSHQSGKEGPIIAALSVRNETQCTDTKPREIEANLAFTNTSASDIILRRGLGQNVTVLGLFGTKTLSPLMRSWSSESDGGPNSKATEVIIHPGNTVAYSVPLKLDAEVLKQPGFYKVQMSYDAKTPTQADGMIGRTNWTIIQVRECEASAALDGGDTIDPATGNLHLTIPLVATAKPSR